MKTAIRVQREDFDLNKEVTLLAGDGESGAVASFTGHVRKENDLSTLTLEHYPHMTEAEIARLVAEAGSRWPLTGVTVIHRVGALRPGDRIVLVAVASQHRHAAFAACEFLMDYLKTHAPFWKEETRAAGHHWVEHHTGDDEAAKRWDPSTGSG
ncbi:MAG TPA: molybdopterin synthase catalytic subunit MoaE [Rhizomicrobium sp.]|nr:molybdopterin synthase catalytic subunit MoaE [Rhizomicrobium sp.]